MRADAVRYAMSERDEAERVELACRVGERLDDDHWLIVGGSRSLAGQLGRVVEQRVFDAEWGGHSPEVMLEEYGPYDDRSIFVVIVTSERAVACGRTIWSPDASEPLKIEVDLGWSPRLIRHRLKLTENHGSDGLWECATMAVMPEARMSRVIGWVIGEMRWQEMAHAGERPSLAVVASTFYRLMRHWGAEVELLFPDDDPIEYLGVASNPVVLGAGRHSQTRSRGAFTELTAGLRERIDRPLEKPLIDLRQPAAAELSISA